MRLRMVVVLLAAALAAVASLPVRVGPARAQDGGRSDPGRTESRLPGRDLRPGEPGSFHVLEVAPRVPVADLVFLHGHADRAANHRDLFAAWARAGVHVIAVDLPSHGTTSVRGIDAWSMGDLAALVGTLDRRYGRTDRPLILAGWSFGGLIVTRMLQEHRYLASLGRRPAAAVLLVPAVDPLPLTGGDGIARRRTLSHDPDPAAAPPHPVSPSQNPLFAVRSLAEAWAARAGSLPTDVPVFVVASDPAQDVYVDVDGLLRWVHDQRRRAAGRVDLLACTGARHAVDLEPWPTGPTVRAATVRFLASVLADLTARGDTVDPPVSDEERTCRPA